MNESSAHPVKPLAVEEYLLSCDHPTYTIGLLRSKLCRDPCSFCALKYTQPCQLLDTAYVKDIMKRALSGSWCIDGDFLM